LLFSTRQNLLPVEFTVIKTIRVSSTDLLYAHPTQEVQKGGITYLSGVRESRKEEETRKGPEWGGEKEGGTYGAFLVGVNHLLP
jgi:hypothetical protein